MSLPGPCNKHEWIPRIEEQRRRAEHLCQYNHSSEFKCRQRPLDDVVAYLPAVLIEVATDPEDELRKGRIYRVVRGGIQLLVDRFVVIVRELCRFGWMHIRIDTLRLDESIPHVAVGVVGQNRRQAHKGEAKDDGKSEHDRHAHVGTPPDEHDEATGSQ